MVKAIGTIMLADAAMGLDNVVAIAGASGGSMILVILGLLISVPVMVFGSTLVMKLMDRFPIVIYIGAGILAYTASDMILTEHFLSRSVDALSYGKYAVQAVLIAGVLLAGKLANSKQRKTAHP
jgi:predicted tellurium resistance membrane protein TerC